MLTSYDLYISYNKTGPIKLVDKSTKESLGSIIQKCEVRRKRKKSRD